MAKKFLTSLDLSKCELLNASIHNLAAAPSSPANGQIYFNTGDAQMYYYNGTSWQSMSGDITSVDITAGTGINVTQATAADGAYTSTVSLRHLGIENLTDPNADRILFWDDSEGTAAWLSADTNSGITISGTSLSLASIPNSSLTNSSLTVTAGAGLVTGGAVSLGGSVTVDAGEGIGISVNPDNIQLKGAQDVDANAILRWDAAEGQIANSSIHDDGNTVTISADLTVNGTVTTVNTETINLADNIITLNSNETAAPSQDAGLEVERGTETNVSLVWDESALRWTFSNDGTTYNNIPVPSEYNAYVHPTQVAIDVNAGALEVIDRIQVDTNGHVTSITKRTFQDALTTQKGIVELATNEETRDLVDTARAVTPRGLAALRYTAPLNPGGLTTVSVPHNLESQFCIVQVMELAGGATVECDVRRVDPNTVELDFCSAPEDGALQVMIIKVA